MTFVKGRSGNPSGRRARAEKFARPIARAEKQIVDRLPERVDRLEFLADGGYEQVTEHWEPAGSLWIDDGDAKQPMFPDKKPDELVLIKRTRTFAAPDRAANIYLLDRIMGKPT